MPAATNVGADGVRDSLTEVVALLQAELDELLQQKAGIKLRMRNLRRRLGILQAGCVGARSVRRKSRRSGTVARRAQSRKICHLHDELSRACRIAFLELGGTATAEEIYTAIARRGSFVFSLLEEHSIAAIARTLESMAQSGEVACGSDSRWTFQPEARNFQ